MPTYRFGKHPPKVDYRVLLFADYLVPALPPPPPTWSVLSAVEAKLKETDPTKLYPMDGNDSLGDCTIAGLAHAVTTFRGLVGQRLIPAKADVVKLYNKLTGGVDSGLNMLDVVNYWRKSGALGDTILAFAKAKPTTHAHIQHAIQMFGGVYLGFQVQSNCIADFEAHKPWTPGKLLNEGHCVYAVGYDPQYLTILTWGTTQKGTWAWWDECVDEAYVILPPEAKTAGFAPGFNFAQLQADLAAVAG